MRLMVPCRSSVQIHDWHVSQWVGLISSAKDDKNPDDI